jgi:RES domain-containing protein
MSDFDQAILNALDEMDASPWEGHAWRHVFNDNPPANPNTGGARWNPRDVPAIYTALDRDGAVAEGDHLIAVQSVPRMRARRNLYEMRIRVNQLVDLTRPGSLELLGLTTADVESDDWTKCQSIGGCAAWLGYGGLLVPSARFDGSNLVVLVGDLGADEFVEVLGREPLE